MLLNSLDSNETGDCVEVCMIKVIMACQLNPGTSTLTSTKNESCNGNSIALEILKPN